MATVRGFRAVNNTYGPFYPDFDDDTVTEVDPAPVGPMHVHLNPFVPAHGIVWHGRRTNPDRLLLVEYDDADEIAAGGDDLAYLVKNSDPPSPLYSRGWRRISEGVVVDEIAEPHDVVLLALTYGGSELDELQAVLDPYGWGDFEPARVS